MLINGLDQDNDLLRPIFEMVEKVEEMKVEQRREEEARIAEEEARIAEEKARSAVLKLPRGKKDHAECIPEDFGKEEKRYMEQVCESVQYNSYGECPGL